MNSTLNYILNFTTKNDKVIAAIEKIDTGLEKVTKDVAKVNDAFDKSSKSIEGSIKKIALNAVIDQIEKVANGIESINKPGMALSTSMSDLSAVTGVTGEKLKEIEGYARKSAKTFGNEAAEGVESYKLILGKLSPEIAKVPKALAGMGDSVAVTSKLMAGDSVGAAELLTTAMNQYGISTEDPIQASKEMAKMMNVMAAAAREGSAELPEQKAALEQSGMAAKGAGVEFEETAAAIQILDKAGKKGSEGAVALRNVLAKIGQGRYIPKEYQEQLKLLGVDTVKLGDKNLTLAERLNVLKPAMKDSALLTAWLGEGADLATKALIDQIPEMERLTKAITGTNSAYEQAAIVMESPAEKNKRLQAGIDDFKISLFNATNGALGYANVLGSVAKDIGNLLPLISLMTSTISFLTNAQKMSALWTSICSGATAVWTGVQSAFNAVMAMNPVVLIVLAVVALIAVIAIVAAKTEGWGAAWDHTMKACKLLFMAYVESVKWQWNTLINGIMIGLNVIKKGWYEFKNATGIGEKDANNAMIAKINADTENRKKAIVDGAKKVADLAGQSVNEFKLAGQSLHWKKDKEADKDDSIAPAGLPGMPEASTQGGGKNSAAQEGKKTAQAVATGGTKHNYITINIKEQIGIKADTVNGSKKDIANVGDQLKDELLRVIATATTAGN